MNSIEVVFIPSRSDVIKARSATESRPKYSSRSIAWWLALALAYIGKLTRIESGRLMGEDKEVERKGWEDGNSRGERRVIGYLRKD